MAVLEIESRMIMKERKTARVMVNIEPTIYRAMTTYLDAHNIKQTDFLRKLIIDAMKNTHMLNDEMIVAITTG